MRRSRIDYGRLVEGALRSVVRDVLEQLGQEGVSSPHHFYVTFRTGHPGVSMPAFLRDRYPVDMTVVLQHQFWDLEVTDDAFGVTLSFNDQLHRLHIPLVAIKVFADPGVEFGLQFTLDDETDDQVPSETARLPGPSARDGADDLPEGGAEIVTLDRFRKK